MQQKTEKQFREIPSHFEYIDDIVDNKWSFLQSPKKWLTKIYMKMIRNEMLAEKLITKNFKSSTIFCSLPVVYKIYYLGYTNVPENVLNHLSK